MDAGLFALSLATTNSRESTTDRRTCNRTDAPKE